MLAHVKEVLGNLGRHFPDLKGRDHEVVGFGWHQGWNDGCGMPATLAYEKNLANFIRDVRKELGIKNLPLSSRTAASVARTRKWIAAS
jgi:hypothetical protein